MTQDLRPSLISNEKCLMLDEVGTGGVLRRDSTQAGYGCSQSDTMPVHLTRAGKGYMSHPWFFRCEMCGFIGSQKLAHNCEKTQFESKGGGYCANNCGYFTKLWQNMRNHTRVLICKAKNTNSSFSQKYSTTNISDSSLSQTLNCDNFIEEMSPPALPDSNGFYSKQNESKTSEKLKKWLHEKVILKENIDDVTTKTTNYVEFLEKNQLLTTKNYFPSAADVKDSIGKNLKVVKIVETSVENLEKSIKIVHPSSTTNLKSSSSEIFLEESQAA